MIIHGISIYLCMIIIILTTMIIIRHHMHDILIVKTLY